MTQDPNRTTAVTLNTRWGSVLVELHHNRIYKWMKANPETAKMLGLDSVGMIGETRIKGGS